jgi:hypothetical protein
MNDVPIIINSIRTRDYYDYIEIKNNKLPNANKTRNLKPRFSTQQKIAENTMNEKEAKHRIFSG